MSVLNFRILTIALLGFCIGLESTAIYAQGGGFYHDPCDSGNGNFYFVGFSPDGRYVYGGWQFRGGGPEEPDTYDVWDTQTGKFITRVYSAGGPFAISPNNAYFASADADNYSQVDIINAKKGNAISSVARDIVDDWTLSFLPDNKRLMVVERGQARLWDIGSATLIHTFPSSGGVRSKLSADGSLFVTGTINDPEILTLWNVTNGQKITSFDLITPAEYATLSDAISPDNKLVIVTGDAAVDIWNAKTGSGNLVKYSTGTEDRHKELAIDSISADDHYAAFIAQIETPGPTSKYVVITPTVELWDLKQQKPVWDLSSLETDTIRTSFPDLNHLLVVSAEGFHLWDLKTRTLQIDTTFSLSDGTAPAQWPTEAVISPDGRYLLMSANYDRDTFVANYISLWNIRTGQKLRMFCD